MRIYLAKLKTTDDELEPLKGVVIRTPWGPMGVIAITSHKGRAVVTACSQAGALIAGVAGIYVKIHAEREKRGTLAGWNKRGWRIVSQDAALRLVPPPRFRST